MVAINVVFAKTTASLRMSDGQTVTIRVGTHWPENDPVVVEHPGAFTTDPRYGMSWTGPAPHYMSLPPDAPLVEEATARPGERRTLRRDV
jgi:hypothetical protein